MAAKKRPVLKGMDAFMQAPKEEKPVSQDASTPVNQPTGLMKATYYITVEQDLKLERIRLSRRRKGIKTDKSELIREAIDLLKEE